MFLLIQLMLIFLHCEFNIICKILAFIHEHAYGYFNGVYIGFNSDRMFVYTIYMYVVL